MQVKSVFREYKRDAREFTRHNEWFQTTALLLFGAVVGQVLDGVFPGHHWITVIPFLFLMAAMLTLPLLKAIRRLQKKEAFLNANREIRDPDPLAERRVREQSEPYPVIGSAIETLVHSTLNTKARTDLGWDPARVQIVDTSREFDAGPILRRIPGGLLPLRLGEIGPDPARDE